MSSFTDPAAVARYAEGPARIVPGFADLHRMIDLLLSERLGPQAQVLVLGAGGGMELRNLADAHDGWRFTGVDPSAPMLEKAAELTESHAARISLHHGYIDTAPPGPFDGATCLLTLHFVPRDQRLPTLTALRQRLKPGAPLVVAHLSFPQDEPAKTQALARYAAFGTAMGMPPENMKQAGTKIGAELPVLSPDDDAATLRAAGFTDVTLFYAAFAFRGWVATA